MKNKTPQRAFAAIVTLVLSLALSLSLTGCSGAPHKAASAGTSAGGTQSAPAPQSATSAAPSPEAASAGNSLVSIWVQDKGPDKTGEAGFYGTESPRFDGFSYLLFYDYNAREQRYVCTVAGCAHSGESCGACLGKDAAAVFLLGDTLYCYRTHIAPDSGGMESDTVLERRNPDGTQPQVVVEGTTSTLFGGMKTNIFTDGQALYGFAGWQQDVLTRVDLVTGEVTNTPCNGEGLLRYSNGRTLLCLQRSGETELNNSGEIILAAINVDTAATQPLHTWKRSEFSPMSIAVQDGKLYYTNPTTCEIWAYDLATDSETMVTNAFAQYDRPIARNWAQEPGIDSERAALLQEREPVSYPANAWALTPADGWLFINRGRTDDAPVLPAYHLQTGETQEITLSDYWNAAERPITLHAATPHGLLVTQETRPVTLHMTSKDGSPFSVESDYPVYALIDTADFVSSTPNFRTIQPLPYGN